MPQNNRVVISTSIGRIRNLACFPCLLDLNTQQTRTFTVVSSIALSKHSCCRYDSCCTFTVRVARVRTAMHDPATGINPVFLAHSRLRRRRFDDTIQLCTDVLEKNKLDQQVWFLKVRATTLKNWVDDTELEEEGHASFIDCTVSADHAAMHSCLCFEGVGWGGRHHALEQHQHMQALETYCWNITPCRQPPGLERL